MHAHIHACTHTHTNTYTDTHTQTNMHTHPHPLKQTKNQKKMLTSINCMPALYVPRYCTTWMGRLTWWRLLLRLMWTLTWSRPACKTYCEQLFSPQFNGWLVGWLVVWLVGLIKMLLHQQWKCPTNAVAFPSEHFYENVLQMQWHFHLNISFECFHKSILFHSYLVVFISLPKVWGSARDSWDVLCATVL